LSLSVVSVWEMQIKLQLSKLRLALPLKDIIESQQQTNSIEICAGTRAGIGKFASSSLLWVAQANQPSHKHSAKPTPDLSVQKLTCVHRAHISGE